MEEKKVENKESVKEDPSIKKKRQINPNSKYNTRGCTNSSVVFYGGNGHSWL